MTIECNGQLRDVAPGTTIAELLAELGLNPRQVAVEVNMDVVPRGEHGSRVLQSGDRLELVTLVGGG